MDADDRWNHNLHHHPLILGALPSPCDRVLDVETMEAGYPALEGHRSLVSDLAIAADGTIVSVSDDGTARLWDAAVGDPIGGPIPTGGAGFPMADVEPFGARVLLTGRDGIFELDLRAESWTRAACRVAGRALTPEELDRIVESATASPCT